MTDTQSPATHPAKVMTDVMEEINSACAFVAREDGFDSAQALRVALRRLRSGLTLFRPLLPPEHNKALLEEARWLAVEVTRLRDLYLLSQDTLTPARVALPNNAALAALEERVLAATARERQSLTDLLDGARVAALLAAAAEMCDEAFWKPVTGDTARLETLCHDVMEVRLAQATKHGESLKRLDPQTRDSFRKALRKLRATAEYSQILFANKKTKAFLKQLKKLLDAMTAARDASAVRDTLEWLIADMEEGSAERHIAGELIRAKASGVTLDAKRLQKLWRATVVLPLY